jgi:hypothetical protein
MQAEYLNQTCKKFLGQIVSYFDPTWPLYRFLIVIRMLCCYLNVFVFVYIINLKEYSFHSMHRCQDSF